ncbi:MAG: diacylglycerol kinase family protein [Tissierellia bacterium]|nr:diacylglycerol kinase family protein [Tissierellia bacterium]
MRKFEKVLVLINSEGKKKVINSFVSFLKEHFAANIEDGTYMIYRTVDASSTREKSREFSKKYKNSLIVAVGGDGTVHEIINSIDFDNTSLAIIPNGTGNDFASHLYGPMTYDEIFNKLLKPKFSKTDVVKINEHYCMNVTSFGYDTVVLKKSLELKEKLPFFRNLSFKLAILMTLSKIEPVSYSYEFIDKEGKLIKGQGEYILNAICNGARFGGGFRPAPEAKIDDGIIEVNQIDNMSLFRFLSRVFMYQDGSHIHKVKESHNFNLLAGKIRPKGQKIYGNIDGELYEFDKIDFEVMPKRINLMH